MEEDRLRNDPLQVSHFSEAKGYFSFQDAMNRKVPQPYNCLIKTALTATSIYKDKHEETQAFISTKRYSVHKDKLNLFSVVCFIFLCSFLVYFIFSNVSALVPDDTYYAGFMYDAFELKI